jgi:hypothetical protein
MPAGSQISFEYAGELRCLRYTTPFVAERNQFSLVQYRLAVRSNKCENGIQNAIEIFVRCTEKSCV